MLHLESRLNLVPGIGPKIGRILANEGISSVRDLLNFLPRDFDDLTSITPISQLIPSPDKMVIRAALSSLSVFRSSIKRMAISQAVIKDDTGTITAIWFNQPYLRTTLKKDEEYFFVGKVDRGRRGPTLINPSFEPTSGTPIHSGRIVPVYPSVQGITARIWRRLMRPVLPLAETVPDILPPSLKQTYNLADLGWALKEVHSPTSPENLARARERLSFDEIFLTQLGVQQLRQFLISQPARPIATDLGLIRQIIADLPYTLTPGQKKALWEILQDMAKDRPTNRLLMGDVGSGKTVLAGICMIQAAKAGFQSALMAPTEVLAIQHFHTLAPLLEKFGVRTSLWTQNQKVGDLKTADAIIGTHAVIQNRAEFGDLNLVIVDEQHRFGVKQREALKHKGGVPHFVSLTATPIPRSLALTMFGDLDISVLTDKPKLRKPTITQVISSANKQSAYQRISTELAAGHQAFVVAPVIEEGSAISATSAEAEFATIKKLFPKFAVGLLHGRLTSDDKADTMRAFEQNKINILVATTVIEVGVDIPNATVMLIEGAERFGLSQLHQLRGRIGRSEYQSYCFVCPTGDDQTVSDRLSLFAKSNNGFELAELDLKLRGPGSLFGYSQSGFVKYRLADWTDIQAIETARSAAQTLIEQDPTLIHYPELKAQVEELTLTHHRE